MSILLTIIAVPMFVFAGFIIYGVAQALLARWMIKQITNQSINNRG